MISLKNIYSKFSLLLLVCMTLAATNEVSASVAAKKERVRMKMYYFKNDAGERRIQIGLTAGSGKNMHGVKNAQVVLTSVLNDSTVTLATLETDTIGEVTLYFASDFKLPMDEEGKSIISASYDGNEENAAASSELEISDIELEFSFEIEDSVKYLSVAASKLDGEGNKVPVEALEINIGVQRLYSVLPIEKTDTDEDGIAQIEIPNDLPGNEAGVLTFVARIEDNDEFGNVTKSASQDWGTPVSYEIKPLPRQLYTDEAPIWMIASVCIILLGAWYHFFLSISKLMKMKKGS
jgi:hypothetical protein